jgi:hypothetical protein
MEAPRFEGGIRVEVTSWSGVTGVLSRRTMQYVDLPLTAQSAVISTRCSAMRNTYLSILHRLCFNLTSLDIRYLSRRKNFTSDQFGLQQVSMYKLC